MKTSYQYRVIKRASLEEKPYLVERRKLETRYRYFGTWGPYEEWGEWIVMKTFFGLPARFSTKEYAISEINQLIKKERLRNTSDEIVATIE